jgi:PKD repeat protein
MKQGVLTLALVLAVCAGGCPLGGTTQLIASSPVDAKIAASSTSGAMPLPVQFSATGSTTSALGGGALTFAWDFGDGATSSAAEPAHTFTQPGLFRVTLRATDAVGNVDLASVDIRVQGEGAVAVIGADRTSGDAPLTVQFDGSGSIGRGDDVRDYYWNFGDGGTSRETAPWHVFEQNGTYTVTLRIATAGGIEATTSTNIVVGARSASLQFDGRSLARLPLSASVQLTRCTFEAWVQADDIGGTVAVLGQGAITLTVDPAGNTVRATVNGTSGTGNSTRLADTWNHLAIVYDSGMADDGDGDGTGEGDGDPTPTSGFCGIYLNGNPLAQFAPSGTVNLDGITLGNGFRGRLSEVRFWTEARAASAVDGMVDSRATGLESNLLGAWPLDEGTGQTLENLTGGPDGTLGSSREVETSDPAWSTQGPAL